MTKLERREDYLLEALGISKAYAGVQALCKVDLRLRRGSVHALMGENGAGKSTLMKVLAGVISADAGTLRLDGRTVAFNSPRHALTAGIAMIHQELSLMPDLSVAENIWLGREPRRGAPGFIDHQRMVEATQTLLARLHIALEPNETVRNLSIAHRQLIEIARALSFNAKVIIMDEPTSALSTTEAAHLSALIRELRAQGTGIIYITHKIEEVLEIGDELTVLRDGRHVATRAVRDCSAAQLIHDMVGRELSELFPKYNSPTAEVVLEVRGLSLADEFSQVSFKLHKGEILGIAGMIGSGRTALAEALFGVKPASSGEILIAGNAAKMHSPQAALSRGLGFVTEDRGTSGCFSALGVLDNLAMASLDQRFTWAGWLRERTLRAHCARLLASLNVKIHSLEQSIDTLSGGNQQKVLLGRWLLRVPRILILDEPTRGVDVGAKAEIHQLISKLACDGMALIVISSELPELLGVSDRIMVMHEGLVRGTLPRSQATQVQIMQLASA